MCGKKIQVAVIGTQGVPASYGGFESLVENLLGENCPDNVQYTVFCSSADLPRRLTEHKGAHLRYIPLHANGIQSIFYDIISMCKALHGYDVMLILGVSGCMFLPMVKLLSKSRVVVNIDGLEHRRKKWGRFAKWTLRTSEAVAVKYGDVIIADNKGIQDYVTETYGKQSEMIAYGGDHVKRELPDGYVDKTLADYGLSKAGYAISVCRIEPENNSHLILEAFARSRKVLVFIGNWDHSPYSVDLYNKYSSCPNIKLLNAIYDLDKLYALRSNAAIYIHGHSAGGTNPSLVEAMFFGIPIFAYDVVYNRETTKNQACYFKTADELTSLLESESPDGAIMCEIAENNYTWRKISNQYCRLY